MTSTPFEISAYVYPFVPHKAFATEGLSDLVHMSIYSSGCTAMAENSIQNMAKTCPKWKVIFITLCFKLLFLQ